MEFSSKIHEECGVFGIYSQKTENVAGSVYYGLFALQHRGQEGCGIVVNDDGVFNTYKDLGLVNDVFTPEVIEKLGMGNMAVGHCSYGAAGTNTRENCQPAVINHIKGRMAIAHNGALTNAFELRSELELKGSIFHTTSDTEIISYLITQERLNCGSIETAIAKAMPRLQGAYSLVVMSPSKLIAVRDPHGFRPLCYGKTEDGRWVIASESCALEAVSATFVRDVLPGEIVVFSENGVTSITDNCNTAEPSLCIFEYIYFARPDSVIDGVSVHKAHKIAGACLADAHPVEADVVIGVPDSGIDAALGYAERSGIPYGIGFIKNKYIGRTFIAPGQNNREDKVRIKLNPVSETVKGKRVVLIDDSIVRGTTSERIVKLLREAGATEVHMRVSAPPFIAPCYYGTDVDSKDNLIACRMTHEQIEKSIGVDSLGFLSIEDLPKLACSDKCKYCIACFNEKYPTAVPDKTMKTRYDRKLSERDAN